MWVRIEMIWPCPGLMVDRFFVGFGRRIGLLSWIPGRIGRVLDDGRRVLLLFAYLWWMIGRRNVFWGKEMMK